MGKQFRLRKMHNKIKLVTSRTKRRNECSCIEDKSGKILFDSKQIVATCNQDDEEWESNWN